MVTGRAVDPLDPEPSTGDRWACSGVLGFERFPVERGGRGPLGERGEVVGRSSPRDGEGCRT
jgi:hypothetical protein